MRGDRVEPPVHPEPLPSVARPILHELDTARLQRFHWRTIVIAGMGFFTDAYDLFVISLVIPILATVTAGGLSITEKGLLGAVALLGAMVGQILFGFLGDRLGRKRIYAITLSVMSVAAIGSALSAPFAGLTTVQVLMLWRFLLGVGLGGDYPLSATIMSEYSNVRSRGRLVATVFAMQGFGLLTGAAATLGVVFAVPNLDIAWRIILGLGALPALLTIYFRTRMPETPRYSLLVEGRADEAAAAVRQLTGAAVPEGGTVVRTRVPLPKLLRMYGSLIFGTALSWLLLDVAFYSTNIFNPTVLTGIGFGTAGVTGVELVRTLALGNVLIAVLFTVPGYWASVALIDRVGRRPLQYIGFGVMATSFLVLSFEYTALRTMLPAFLFLYGTTFFFANFGPNTTTFVYPTEVFPTSFRTTGHGVAAAAGKLGAVIGVFYFPLLVASGPNGLALVFEILALVSFLGLLTTIAFLPETSQRSLEDSSGEDELAVMVRRFSTYLRSLSLTVGQGATALAELLAAPGENREAKVENLRALEHRADEEVHRIFIELNNRKLSPEVRTDVGHLASALDDIMDGIEAVGARVKTYRLDVGRPELSQFARIVVACVDQVAAGILGLDDLYRGSMVRLQQSIIEVNRLENEADDLLRVLLEELFQRPDPVEILKWKDFYERLEVITDRCEDVTDVFQDLAVRYAPNP
jgi:PHS family inorganic phosphate transporter-like MFS transporter